MKKLVIIMLVSTIGLACQENKSSEKSIQTEEIHFTKNGELQFMDETDRVLKTVDIETAVSGYEQETGLMYRKSMAENQGMLFIYNDERPRPNFYMKNTLIGLDLIYINSQMKVVDINENAKPMDESLLPSNAPAQYVLEVNAGMAKKWNLQIGDSVHFKLDE